MPYKDPEKYREYNRQRMAKARAEQKATQQATQQEEQQEKPVPCSYKPARVWAAIVYPDSAPKDWEAFLSEEYKIQWACSPLHDKDINDDGSPKKPHWHILISFEGKKSYRQVYDIVKSINASNPQPCNSQKGMIRYFAHKDNPEKAQYSTADIRAFGGYDLDSFMKPSASEGIRLQKEMQDFCIKYEVTEFVDLVAYASHEREDWLDELTRSSFLLIQLIKSIRHSEHRPCNPVTGEIYGEGKPTTMENELQEYSKLLDSIAFYGQGDILELAKLAHKLGRNYTEDLAERKLALQK